MMMNKLRKNAKALSPIFATLILIAIAVIAGIVVYMFTSGTIASMTGGGTIGQEKVAVQGVDWGADQIFAQNTGGTAVTITNVITKAADGSVVGPAVALATPVTMGIGSGLQTIILPATTLSGLPIGSYTVTLVSSAGGSFVSSSFVVTQP